LLNGGFTLSVRPVLVAAGLALALSACAGGDAATAWPNINKVPERPERDVLTTEESQQTIADMEALAEAEKLAAACNDPDVEKLPAKDREKCPKP